MHVLVDWSGEIGPVVLVDSDLCGVSLDRPWDQWAVRLSVLRHAAKLWSADPGLTSRTANVKPVTLCATEVCS